MSVGGLAKAAQVSPQTVYNSVGNKAEVVKAVCDVLIAGDESAVPMSERTEFLAVGEAPDRDTFGGASAGCSAGISRRVAPLLGGAARRRGRQRHNARGVRGDHRRGAPHLQHRAMTLLEQKHGLPTGRLLSELIDEVWTPTAPQVCDRLTRRRRWTFERYSAWLSDAVAQACTRTGTVAAG